MLVEQNLAAALTIANRVVIMNSGQVALEATPEEARKANVWSYL